MLISKLPNQNIQTEYLKLYLTKKIPSQRPPKRKTRDQLDGQREDPDMGSSTVTYLSGDPGYKSIASLLRARQRNSCYFCKHDIGENEPIVRRGHQKSRYYHEACARQVNVI